MLRSLAVAFAVSLAVAASAESEAPVPPETPAAVLVAYFAALEQGGPSATAPFYDAQSLARHKQATLALLELTGPTGELVGSMLSVPMPVEELRALDPVAFFAAVNRRELAPEFRQEVAVLGTVMENDATAHVVVRQKRAAERGALGAIDVYTLLREGERWRVEMPLLMGGLGNLLGGALPSADPASEE